MRSWKMHLRTDKDLGYLARVFNPKLRGWIQYYGKFRISALRRGMQDVPENLGEMGEEEIQTPEAELGKSAGLYR